MISYCFNSSLTKQDIHPTPPGWFHFYGMCSPEYFNNTWNIDGTLSYTGNQPENYSTSILGNSSSAWISAFVKNHPDKPFHVVVAPHAPHGPYTPAPWYAHTKVEKLVRLESWNYSASTHIPWVADLPGLTEAEGTRYNVIWEDRWRTMMSVDDLVNGIFKVLEDSGILNNTYVLFTSDHGFHIGSFRMGVGKQSAWETDIRVPMIWRGPDIVPGSTTNMIASHVDLAPTFLDLAGVPIPNIMDGKSVVPFLTQPNLKPDVLHPFMLIEEYPIDNWSANYTPGVTNTVNDCPNNTFRALRILNEEMGDILYTEFTNIADWNFESPIFYEMYNITEDPFQLNNLYYSDVPSSISSQNYFTSKFANAPSINLLPANKLLHQELHEMIVKAFSCNGSESTPSNCL